MCCRFASSNLLIPYMITDRMRPLLVLLPSLITRQKKTTLKYHKLNNKSLGNNSIQPFSGILVCTVCFRTQVFVTQEKSEMLTLVEIFSLADISYKIFFKQPSNLSKGLLTEKRQSKKLPMKPTKLFSFLNLATHPYLQH